MSGRSLKALTPRQEAFAVAFVETGNATEAYRRAYAPCTMAPHAVRTKAYELKNTPHVAARIATMRAELDAEMRDRYRVTTDRVIAELYKIGCADIRKAVRWHGSLVQDEDNPDGGDTLVIRNVYTTQVEVVSSDDVDDDTAGAIAEVSQTPNGGLKVKMHDKMAALNALARHLGMFVDKTEVTGKDGAPLVAPEEVSNRQLARAILDVLREAQLEKGKDQP